MHKWMLIPILFICTSCAQYRGIVATYTSEAARATLETAAYTHCRATAGALEDKYKLFTDPNGPQATAWRGLCYGADEEVE